MFVDLAKVFNAQFIALHGSRLKNVAPQFGFTWRVPDLVARSQTYLSKVRSGADPGEVEAARQWLLSYSEDDNAAMAAIRKWHAPLDSMTMQRYHLGVPDRYRPNILALLPSGTNCVCFAGHRLALGEHPFTRPSMGVTTAAPHQSETSSEPVWRNPRWVMRWPDQ